MNFKQSIHPKKFSIAFLTTTLLLSGGVSAIAQSFPIAQARIIFPPGRDRGAPDRTTGAGSRREGCIDQSSTLPLTALTPSNNIVKTASDNPSIYIYVPKVLGKTASFRLIDKQAEEILYETEIALEDSPGILELSLPETVQLQSDTLYEWGFFIQCDPNNPMSDEGIEGWLERSELTSEQAGEIEQAAEDPLKQAQLYAEAGMWNETLGLVAGVRDSNPTAWEELLESVGLDPEIARSSLIVANRDR